ncbi:MAG: hypothetical protein IT522_11685 [Burkholderiales bacterium]|nr:hypothetical protein [Burkholderiales bacterium]
MHNAHYNRGRYPVAFVFSTPGARELAAGRPVAGITGENLDFALGYLHAADPRRFPTIERYAYRITNAHTEPLAASLGHATSEATPAQILAPDNIARVVEDLTGCDIVVLCGQRAQLLIAALALPGRVIARAAHTGNRALVAKYHGPAFAGGADGRARRILRARQWARDLLHTLPPGDG